MAKYKYIATCVGCMIAGFGGLYYVMDYACGVWSNDAFGDSKRLKEETFLKMPIFLPDKERQDSIATLISSIMMKLNKADKTLNLLIKQKQYLLRQMFI